MTHAKQVEPSNNVQPRSWWKNLQPLTVRVLARKKNWLSLLHYSLCISKPLSSHINQLSPVTVSLPNKVLALNLWEEIVESFWYRISCRRNFIDLAKASRQDFPRYRPDHACSSHTHTHTHTHTHIRSTACRSNALHCTNHSICMPVQHQGSYGPLKTSKTLEN